MRLTLLTQDFFSRCKCEGGLLCLLPCCVFVHKCLPISKYFGIIALMTSAFSMTYFSAFIPKFNLFCIFLLSINQICLVHTHIIKHVVAIETQS